MAVTVTPYNDLNGLIQSTTGTWTKISGTSGTAPGTYNGTASLTAPDTVVFRYTVTSGSVTDTADVTYNVTSAPSVPNDVCTTATTLTYPSDGRGSILAEQTNVENCPITSAPTQDTASLSWPAGFPAAVSASGDLWYSFTASAFTALRANFTLTVRGDDYGIAGILQPYVEIYTHSGGVCGSATRILTGTPSPNSRNVSVSHDAAVATGTTFFIRVACAAGNEGSFDIRIQNNN